VGDTGAPPPAAALAVLAERWAGIRGGLAPLLDEDANTIEIGRGDYESLLAALHERRPFPEIARMLAAWALEPMALRLARVAEQSRRIARRVGKGELDIEIRDHDLRLDPALWSSFWSSFIHVVRNAVDHGLERADERVRAGKPERARLLLESRIDDGELVIAIEDDGRGIDLHALTAAAARFGIAARTPEQALAAMFHDGVTTASTSSEVSGRGIGMGAVRSACAALGGRVVTRSEPGKYTRFEFRFPPQHAFAHAA
ncbi:MAG TPA: ATP-binding protein, partial [Nannocystaceae bacterium]|nr:ATP-binding protein [Nannocystaceae bacterium]